MGSMTATSRFVTMGALPLGVLVGGLLGVRIGLALTLAVAAAGEMVGAVWLWRSPVRALREHPAPLETAGCQWPDAADVNGRLPQSPGSSWPGAGGGAPKSTAVVLPPLTSTPTRSPGAGV